MLIRIPEDLPVDLDGETIQWEAALQFATGVPCGIGLEESGIEISFDGPEPEKALVVGVLSPFREDLNPSNPYVDGTKSYISKFQSLWDDRMSKLKAAMSLTLRANGMDNDEARFFFRTHATVLESYRETGDTGIIVALSDVTAFPWLDSLTVPGTTTKLGDECKRLAQWWPDPND